MSKKNLEGERSGDAQLLHSHSGVTDPENRQHREMRRKVLIRNDGEDNTWNRFSISDTSLTPADTFLYYFYCLIFQLFHFFLLFGVCSMLHSWLGGKKFIHPLRVHTFPMLALRPHCGI